MGQNARLAMGRKPCGPPKPVADREGAVIVTRRDEVILPALRLVAGIRGHRHDWGAAEGASGK